MIDKDLFLSEIPTRQLLATLRDTYSYRVYFNGERTIVCENTISRMCEGGVEVTLYVTTKDLKEELSKREHVPNKQESKLKRKYLAKKYRRGRKRS